MKTDKKSLPVSSLLFYDRYNKFFSDKLSLHYMLNGYKRYLMRYCAVVVRRENKKVLSFLSSQKEIMSFFDCGQQLSIVKSKNSNDAIDNIRILKKEEECNHLDNKEITIDNLVDFLEEDDLIISSDIKGKKLLQVSTVKDNNLKSYLVGNVCVNDRIQSEILTIADDFPQITFLNFYIFLDDSSHDFTIYKITTDINIDMEAVAFDKVRKKACFKTIIKKQMDIFLRKRGWQGYMYRHWLKGLVDDWKYNGTTVKQKIWANYNGFYSYRIEQYGLTKDNYKEILSDRDYKWLRNINNQYRKLLRDKAQFYYSLQKYKQYLPEYYFHLICFSSKIQLVNLVDKNKKSSFGDILELLKIKKKLAVKPVSASSGRGFLKLEYKENSFFKNGGVVGKQELMCFLKELKEDCIVSEYVEMHQEIRKFYSGAASTIRMMVINKTANNPEIASAYMRLGNKKSGEVDNIGRGGISLLLDHKSGRIINVERLVEHKFIPITHHPDTEQVIQGVVPNWDDVCKKVEKICYYLNPLEYLGLDIVVTDDGFKILEVNLHQELHKYPCYSQEVKNYFKDKLLIKK